MKKILGLCCLLIAPVGLCDEASVTLSSTVTGNREQPRVMYILPWQRPGELDYDMELSPGIADDLFLPVDRTEFVRELDYRALANSAAEAATSGPTANPQVVSTE